MHSVKQKCMFALVIALTAASAVLTVLEVIK
jgi:hypothetical protein